jgi:hypothetical protein
MAKYKTTITEKDGTKKSGYIENGRSYYDDGKEINAGASVTDSSGKTWTKGGSTTTTSSTPSYNQTWESGGRTYVGGVDVGPAGTKVDTTNSISNINAGISQNNSGSSYRPNYGDMGDKMQTNPYEEAYREAERRRQEMEEQIREQNRIAVEQGTNRLNAQKTNINQAAEDNARQAYIMHMQAKKALPQQLVNQGATGGMTETANLGLQTTYQNNLNDINRNKVNAIQEIDNAITDLKTTGDLSTVEQVLANNQAALDSYMSMLDKGVAYNQWANQYNANRADNAYTQAYKEREYADMLKQQARDNELDLIKYNQTQKEKAEKEATQIYDDVYKEAKKRWETGNVDAATIDNWLAQQNITDAEYEAILDELGIKTILDNLYRLGKLS